MQCENCHAQFENDLYECPECGAPVLQTIAGFENTKDIQRKLRHMYTDQGVKVNVNGREYNDIFFDRKRFISLLYDYLPDWTPERRLLISMYKMGLLNIMLRADNREIAIAKAKSLLLNDVFLSEAAAEFVIAAYSYMLGWPFEAKLRVPERDPNEQDDEEEDKPQRRPMFIDEMPCYPQDVFFQRLAGNVNISGKPYTKLEGFCFDGFRRMKTIKLPDTLMAIGEYCFSNCSGLKGIDLPEGMKLIKQGAFSGCSSLAFVKIPYGILEIEDNTFQFCSSLVSVEIPASVGSIGAAAFSGCESLKRLFIPESVKFIDENAFAYCPELVIHCYENSYVYKYCVENGIEVETAVKGADLKRKRI